MAWGGIPVFTDGTRKAGADLSTKQYHFVKLDASSDIIICNGADDVPYGVLQNNPNTGEEAVVMLIGITKLIAGEDISTPATLIATGTDARGEAVVEGTDITRYLVASTIEGGAADGEVATVVVNSAVAQTLSHIA